LTSVAPFVNYIDIEVCPNCLKNVPKFAAKEHLEFCRKRYRRPVAVDLIIEKEQSASRFNLHKVKIKAESRGRKCLRCGKDPKPNYFYCPGCMPEDPWVSI